MRSVTTSYTIGGAPVQVSCLAGERAAGFGVDSANNRFVNDAIPTVSGAPAANGQTPDGFQLTFSNTNNPVTGYVLCLA